MNWALLLAIAIVAAYAAVMWWLRQQERNKPGPSFRPWWVRLKPRHRK